MVLKDTVAPSHSENSTRFNRPRTSQNFRTDRRKNGNSLMLTVHDMSVSPGCGEMQIQNSIIYIHCGAVFRSRFNKSVSGSTSTHGTLQHYLRCSFFCLHRHYRHNYMYHHPTKAYVQSASKRIHLGIKRCCDTVVVYISVVLLRTAS